MQPRLLRVLQEKKIKRIGENQERVIDVRVIAATNQTKAVNYGRSFSPRSIFSPGTLPIDLQSKKTRRGYLFTCTTLLYDFCQQYQLDRQFSRSAIEFLERKNWSGNVRELMDVVQRCMIFSESQSISVDELDLTKTKVKVGRQVQNKEN